MADSLYRVNRGITLNPQSSAPANPTNGDIYYDSTQGTFVFYDNGFWINLASRQDVASAASLTSANFTAAIVANSLIRITGATASTIHGITASTDGNIAVIYNNTNQLITVAHQSGSEATAANRIVTHTAQSIVIPAGMTMKLVYDGSQSRWVFMADAIDGVDKLFEDRNVLLTQGGLITYTGTQVQFTEALKIDVNQREAGGAPVVIDLGSTTRNVSASGRMIYAVIDRVAGTAVVTDDATSLPAAVPLNQEVFLIAKRVDAGDGTKRLYWRNGAALNEGQSARLGASGLTLLASRALVSDSSGNIAASSVTATELGYVSGVTSAIQTQLDAKVPKTLTTTTGDMIYASSANTPARLAIGSSGQVLKTVGGIPTWATFSGGINYLSANPDAESDTSGWATYADAAGTSPVDGTGGSPTTTWTRSTSSPLRGSGSFILTKDAANRQGEGASYDFTIDSTDQAKVLTVSFDYAVASGTYATGDLTVYLYDVTNALVIQPTGYQIESASTGLGMKHVATFQTASNSTSYRLILHVASTSASAYTVKCDNFAVSPQVITQGTPVTDWTSYTPSFGSAWGTVSEVNVRYRRVGDTLEVSGSVVAGTVGASRGNIGLPSGLSVDTTKFNSPVNNTQAVGLFYRVRASGTPMAIFNQATDSIACAMVIDSTTPGFVYPSWYVATNVFGQSPVNNIITSNERVWFEFRVPIQGWSSQVQMSSDTDTRVVAMKAYQASHHTLATGSATKINFSTTTVDTVGAFDAANNRYSVKVSGTYRIYAKLLFDNSASGSRTVQIFKNSTRIAEEQHPATGYTYVSVSTIVDASAGDTFEIKGMQDSGGNLACGFDGGDQTQSAFEVERISGPSQIAASETVAARYSFSGTQTLTGGNDIVDFATKDFDTHGAVTGNGSGINGTWKFTAPVSGQYEMYIMCDFEQTNSGANSTSAQVGGKKNSAAADRFTNYRYTYSGQTTGFSIPGKRTYQLLAGETLKGYAFSNATGASVSSGYIEIRRVGNY